MRYPFDLVSIHIPKSAGTSFRLILQQLYGVEAVQRLDISRKNGLTLNQKPLELTALPEGLKVAHGHFTYGEFVDYFGQPEVPVITWLRHPVKRVISQYFFLLERFEDQVIHSRNSPNVFNRLCRSLLEFAEQTGNRNLQSRYLSGIEPERLDFIGLVEHFEEDFGING
jgi:hypothetical protein